MGVPTWKNGKTGEEHISKRLDRFLMDEEHSELFGKVKSVGDTLWDLRP